MIAFRPLADDHPDLVQSPLLRAALLTLQYTQERERGHVENPAIQLEIDAVCGFVPHVDRKRHFKPLDTLPQDRSKAARDILVAV